MRRNGALQYAGVKLRALLLARGLKEVDLVDEAALRRSRISRGFFSKFTNRLLRGKELASADDPKLGLIAKRLGLPPKLLTDDAAWPDNGARFGLNADEVRTVRWLKSLYEWYIEHAGPKTAHAYMSLDFDVLRRQTQILQNLARTFGDEAVIRVFIDSDHEEGRFDRQFSRIERLARRNAGVRRKILAYVQDIPIHERVTGRTFPPLKLGDLELEVRFSPNMPQDRMDVRYVGRTDKNVRHLVVRWRMDDVRLAFVLAREVAIHLAARDGLISADMYAEHHWPCPIDSYRRARSEVMINRFAAALLLPRRVIEHKAKEILVKFSHETVEAACRELGCAQETLLLRIVQLYPRQAHFIRIDTPGPKGPYTLEKLYRGNGLPVLHGYQSRAVFPESWGVMKCLDKYFSADPLKASAASRHVQLTKIPACNNETYICMSLTYPRFGGGAKALCIGFRLREFKKLYGSLPALSERAPAMDSFSYDVDWNALVELERRSRQRKG